MTCSFDEAKALAQKTVAALGAASGDEFDIVRHKTVGANGWIFFYNSKEFIETGNPSSALAGNGPLFVDLNGVLKILPAAVSWDVDADVNKEPIYSEKDVQVLDAIAAIRKRPHMYLGDNPTGASFAARVVESLILLDAGSLRVERSESWYSISAEKDWLISEGGAVSFEEFQRVVPMPSGGYDWAWVFLAALADAIVTSGADGTSWISGDQANWKLPGELELSLPPKKGRIVAFHFENLVPSSQRA